VREPVTRITGERATAVQCLPGCPALCVVCNALCAQRRRTKSIDTYYGVIYLTREIRERERERGRGGESGSRYNGNRQIYRFIQRCFICARVCVCALFPLFPSAFFLPFFARRPPWVAPRKMRAYEARYRLYFE